MNSVLQKTILRVLRPLIRHLIGQGCTYPALCELLKNLYVAETQRHYAEPLPASTTDSRISLLTGIHRREVKRLRTALARDGEATILRREANLAARIVADWVSMPQHLNADDEPLVLPLRYSPDTASFESLVREAKADVRPKAILDELLRVGVVQMDADDKVRLLRTAYVSGLPEDKLAFLADNVGDHLHSALHNIEPPTHPPFLERAVYYDALPAQELTQLRPVLFRLGDQLLRHANRHLKPLAQTSTAQAGSRRRMRLGVYYYEEDSQEQTHHEP